MHGEGTGMHILKGNFMQVVAQQIGNRMAKSTGNARERKLIHGFLTDNASYLYRIQEFVYQGHPRLALSRLC